MASAETPPMPSAALYCDARHHKAADGIRRNAADAIGGFLLRRPSS
jgi:hypothetical protein